MQPGLTLKGLRHTVTTILSEMGYDERTIADMLGQRTTAMARHYSSRADKTRKLTSVVEALNTEVTRRRKQLSNPPPKLSNLEKNREAAEKSSEENQKDSWCPGAESNHRHADFQSATPAL